MGERAVIVSGGVAGVGGHLSRLSAMCGADAITIVESDPRRLGQLKERFRDRHNITVIDGLPTDARYAIAVVATPAKLHVANVERLIGSSRKLLIESPIARTLAEAEAIVEQFERCDTIGFVGLFRRTLGNFRLARQLHAEGVLGDLERVTMCEGSVSRSSPTSPFSSSRDLDGGGVLLDAGPHALDLLFQVFDVLTLKQAQIDADVGRNRTAAEANCLLELESGTGVPIDVVLSANRHLSNTAVFTFSRGSLTLDTRNNTLRLDTPGGCRLLGTPQDGPARVMDQNELFDAFYRQHIATGANQGVSPRESLNVMRLIDDAYRGAVFTESIF